MITFGRVMVIIWLITIIADILLLLWSVGYLIWGDDYPLLPKKWKDK